MLDSWLKQTINQTIDQTNLTFLKTAQSAKVRRWQLTLQEFDFEYKHIKGEDNVVADAEGSVTTIQGMEKAQKS